MKLTVKDDSILQMLAGHQIDSERLVEGETCNHWEEHPT